jgi:hypothetical protein
MNGQETSIDWKAIRHEFPITENISYLVKDCRYNVFGTAYYNGFDWEDIQWKTPLKGSLILHTYIVTHWCEK